MGELDRQLDTFLRRQPNLGASVYLAKTAVVLGDVTLGDHASVWYHAVLRGDMAPIVIGEATNIQDATIVHVDEGKPALIGSRVGVGHRVILHACIVEDDCLIGMGSILLNDVRVGRGSVIAAGAVVTEGMQVPPESLVMGVPARVVRHVDDGLRARIKETWEHYVAEAERHRRGAFPLERASL